MTSRLKYRAKEIISELEFETTRSSGKGGQHVNKTESRVTAVFNVSASQQFSEEERELLFINLKSRLANGVLRLSSEESRSQHRNKEIVIERLLDMLDKALFVPKKRKPTKISRGKKAARLKSKKQHSEKKSQRKKPGKDDY